MSSHALLKLVYFIDVVWPLSIMEDVGFRQIFLQEKIIFKSHDWEKVLGKREGQARSVEDHNSRTWCQSDNTFIDAVTSCFVDATGKRILRGMGGHLPQIHSAANIAAIKTFLVEEWVVQSGIKCLVTDSEILFSLQMD